eukprot:4405322-Prymnesium_polylepis.1
MLEEAVDWLKDEDIVLMQDELYAITDKFGLTAAGSCEKGCSGCLAYFKIVDEQPPPRLDPLADAPS